MKTTTVWALAIVLLASASREGSAGSPKEDLVKAVKEGDVASVQELLQQGASANETDERGITLLHWSCDNARIAEVLLDKGANVDARTKDGMTPLHWAVANKQSDVARVLIAHKASINAKDKNGDTSLHHAVQRGHNDLAELLILGGADVNAQDEEKMTPLQMAAYSGNEPMVALLRKKGATTPEYDLLDAVLRGDVPKATSLLAGGVRADAPAGIYRSSALHWAALKSRQALLELFVRSGADVNAKDDAKATPLHYAAKGGNAEAIQFLIDKGADIRSIAVRSGTNVFYRSGTVTIDAPPIEAVDGTPLHWAAYAGREDIAGLLLSRGADIEATSREKGGLTPICFAAMQGHERLVQLFAQKGASVKVNDGEFGSPLHYAKTRPIAEALIRGGAPVTPKCEWYGLALHLAAYDGRKDVVELLIEKGLALDDVATWRIYGPYGVPYEVTPLYVAARNGKSDIVTLLITKGADPGFKMGKGAGTALHAAAWSGNSESCAFLIKRGAAVDEKADFDVIRRGFPFSQTWAAVTPLLVASDRGNADAVTLLLGKGADVSAKDGNGRTALDWAANDKVREILQQHGAKSGKQ